MHDYNKQLAIARTIIEVAHKNQVDKAGKPYIGHLLKVSQRVDTPFHKVIALLHDVVEDTNVTLNDLITWGIDENIVNVVDIVTHRPDMSYDEYIERVISNRDASIIKLSDLVDNMNLQRLPVLHAKDVKRQNKYVNTFKKINDRWKIYE